MSLTMSSNYRKMKLENSVKSKTLDFLSKLDADDSIPGLHIEPINNSADKRFRSGRVDNFYRAALFRIDSKTGVIWIVYGVYPHDEVIEVARQVKLSVNPVNGVPEVEYIEPVADLGVGLADDDWQQADWAKQQAAYEEAAKLVGLDTAVAGEPDGGDTNSEPAVSPVLAQTPDPVFGDKPLVETLGLVPDDQLTAVLGVSARALRIARGSKTVDQLLNAFEHAPEVPEWQVDALLDLASGTTVGEVLAKLKGSTEEEDATRSESSPAAGSQPEAPESVVDEEPAAASFVESTAEMSEDDVLALGLQTPAAQLSFAAINGEEELKAVVEDGDFAAWRVFLHPEQRRYAQGNYNGPFRLTGGAGTGKTIVLVHRAVRLAKQSAFGPKPTGGTSDGGAQGSRTLPSRVVLTTYTKNLADQLDEQVRTLDPKASRADKLGDSGLYVSGIDKLVSDVLRGADKDELAAAAATVLGRSRTSVLKRPNGKAASSAWDEALAAATGDLPERARNAQFLADEYEQVVLPARIVDAAAYKKVRRTNRSIRMSRHQRAAVWEVFESYRTRAVVDGTASWEEAPHLAAAILEARAAEVDVPGNSEEERRLAYPTDHVLVDEGQDLKPGHWVFLRALARGGRNDLFIAEDGFQRIYGAKVVLSKFGINIVGRSRKLSLNYRTTEAILRFGLRILSAGKYEDAETGKLSSIGYRSLRVGVEPTLRGFETRDEEFSAIADVLRSWLEAAADNDALQPEENAILVRTSKDANEVQRRLGELGVSIAQAARDSVPRGKPVVMTMHRSKGTEFRNVAIMHVNQDSLPPTWALADTPEEMLQDKLLQERSLLYVAATRARDELVVTYTGERSELLG